MKGRETPIGAPDEKGTEGEDENEDDMITEV